MTDWMARAAASQARPSDPPRDFCLWPYASPRPPAPGALRSVALLHTACDAAGFGDDMVRLMDMIQECWGRFETVWGVKWADGQLGVEFYFYDYARGNRARGMADLIEATRGLIEIVPKPVDALPYFMFSIEVDAAVLANRRLDRVDIYMGNPGSTVSSGICYGLSSEGMELRNFYFFFDAHTQMDAACGKLLESAHLVLPDRARLSLTDFFWPGMEGMQTVVVANKRTRDSLYFSRIDVDQLALFLERLSFPAPIRHYLAENRDKLAHHLYDAGWDFDCDTNGTVTPIKGSFYGLL
jgi:hypothetical protein